MLFKAIVLEALVAAAAVSAQNTTITPIEVAIDAKKTHTPLAQCPGRSKVYVALSKYSAPASFCSSFMSLNGATKTVTRTLPVASADPTTTTETIGTTATVTQTTTETVTTTTTSGSLARCTAGGPNMRRDVSADVLAKASASASASAKAKLPKQLKKFKPKALSSACSCMGYNKGSAGKTVTATVGGASASAPIKTQQITKKASTTTTVITVTSTKTATVTSQVAGIDGAMFAIMATDTNTDYDGIYLALTGESINRAAFSANNIADASDFQIDANNDLTEFDNQSSAISFANQDAGNPCEPVYFDSALNNAMVPLTCCVDDASDLQCGNINGASQFSLGTDTGLLYFCQSNQTANFAQLRPVRMAVQVLDDQA